MHKAEFSGFPPLLSRKYRRFDLVRFSVDHELENSIVFLWFIRDAFQNSKSRSRFPYLNGIRGRRHRRNKVSPLFYTFRCEICIHYTPNTNMADHSVVARDEPHESEVSQSLMIKQMLPQKTLVLLSICYVLFPLYFELLGF